jgi:hypothetical protein
MKLITKRAQFVVGKYYLFKEEEVESVGKYVGYDKDTNRYEFKIVKSNKLDEETGKKLFIESSYGYLEDKKIENIYELDKIETFTEIV